MMYHQYHLEINVTCCTFSFFTRERERERISLMIVLW